MRKVNIVFVLILSLVSLVSSFSPVSADGGRIWIPWRSQFDGTTYASSNCGPAALGMAMSHFGEWWSSNGIRESVNSYLGYWGEDGGSSWESLKHAAGIRDFGTVGLYDSEGFYTKWTIDELVAQTSAGRPVILLVRYWSLPGNEYDAWWGDHYIVFLGLTPDGYVVYHDPAYSNPLFGSYRVMSQERLMRAWTRTATGYQQTAMSLIW